MEHSWNGGERIDTALEAERATDRNVRPARVIACGMIAREVLAVRALCGLDHVELVALPAQWHFEPHRIAAGVAAAVAEARENGIEDVFVGYADCGTGGELAALCRELSVTMLPGPHCFAIYQAERPSEATIERDLRTFYVTDFLARQPDAFLWRPLGLDRHPELTPLYFGAYEAVAYLAQTEDDDLLASARRIAERLGLRFEKRATGYGDLPDLIARWDAERSAVSSPAPLAHAKGAT